MWRWFPEGQDGLVTGFRRATVLKTDDTGTQQMLKQLRGLRGELPEDVYRPQQHGLSSHAPAGSEGLFLALGARSDRLLGLGFEHKDKRPRNLPEGGVALYDADGKLLKLVKDEVSLDAGGKPVRIVNASKITLDVSGTLVVIKPGRIDLGEDNAANAVVTTGGPSSVVFAKV
jgi:phage gp45-like